MYEYQPLSTENLPAPRLKSGNLSEKVVLWIKTAILDGKFTSGSELPSEQELCNLLGVGKSSVREALKMLQMIGVVEIQQGKRTRICQKVNTGVMMPLIFSLMLEQATLEDMFNFRVLFETAVTNYALAHATEDGLRILEEEVTRHHDLCLRHLAKPTDEFVFHRKLFEICQNPYITQIGTLLLDLFTGPILRYEDHDPSRDAVDHEKIVTALKMKDQKMLDEAMRSSFDTYRTMLRQESK